MERIGAGPRSCGWKEAANTGYWQPGSVRYRIRIFGRSGINGIASKWTYSPEFVSRAIPGETVVRIVATGDKLHSCSYSYHEGENATVDYAGGADSVA